MNATDRLTVLARSLARAYEKLPTTRAILLTGSVAEGCADECSDIDIILYHESVPSEQDLLRAMRSNGATERKWLLGDPAEGPFAEAYMVDGVECQFGHATTEAWEREMDGVLLECDIKTPNHKAMSGIIAGIPLFGEDVILQYKAKVTDFPDALAVAMVNGHLSFFPLWGVERRLATRDAMLWRHQALVEGAQNLLGVLAGLNRLYYSTFQFKRMAKFIDQMTIKPPDLYERIQSMLLEPESAVQTYKSLVADTVELVERNMPGVDTAGVRKALARNDNP